MWSSRKCAGQETASKELTLAEAPAMEVAVAMAAVASSGHCTRNGSFSVWQQQTEHTRVLNAYVRLSN